MNENQRSRFRLQLSFNTLILVAISVFLIMKMLRSFSGSTVAGGLWNYIQIAFALYGVVILLTNVSQLFTDKVFTVLFLYTGFCLFNGIFYLQFNRNDLFSFLMLLYPVGVLLISYKDACMRKLDTNMIVSVTFYVIAGIYIFSMLRSGVFSTLTGATADVYYVLGLYPLMLIYTKKFVFIPSIVCGMAIMISGKRLGLVLFVIMVLLYYLLEAIQSSEVKKLFAIWGRLLVISVVFVIAFVLVVDQFNERFLVKLQMMLLSGDSSGRDIVWQRIIDSMGESGFIRWIFGHGDGAVVSLVGFNAHNDFLEILYDFGLVPFFLYIAFYVCCITEAVAMMKQKYEYFPQFVMSLVCSIGLAMSSYYVIAPTYITCGMMCVGYMLMDFRKKHYPNGSILKLRSAVFRIGG